MNKQTVYIPVNGEQDKVVCFDYPDWMDRITGVIEKEAYVLSEEELKQLLSDAFDAGSKSVILQIENTDDNTVGYSKGFTIRKIGERVQPYVKKRSKEEYIENLLNKEK